MPAPSAVGSSPMPTPELAAHSAETGTSLFSVLSPASEQPGSAQSVWPSPSSSMPLSQARLPPAGGVGVGVGVGVATAPGRVSVPPAPARRARPGGAGARRGRARDSTAAAPAGAGLPHSFAASTRAERLHVGAALQPLAEQRAEIRAAAPTPCPPSSAAANVLTPFAFPRSVKTTLPEAATPARPDDRDREPALLDAAGDGHARRAPI